MSRMRRSPFINVRFISPAIARGNQTCDAWPIWRLGRISTSTENNPPCQIATMMASTIALRSPRGTVFMASFTMSVRRL